MTIDQLRDEKEDLVNKAINLSQSIKTLKSELNSREDIANNLKRENKDLKQTLSAAAHGKRYEMYTPIEAHQAIHDANLMPSKFQNQSSGKQSRKGSGKTTSTRRSTSIKSKTPLRESGRTLEENQHAGHNPHYEKHNQNLNAD